MRFELFKARKMAGYNQSKIASLVGITRDKYRLIESGKQKKVDIILASKIAKVLDTTSDTIFLPVDAYKVHKSTLTQEG